MLCDELKFIFIDICKTAGTSINEVLCKYIKEKYGYICKGKHHSIRNITGDFCFCTNLTKEQIDNYFVFTIVRNPWDRMVSLWLWGYKHQYNCSFKEFIYNVRDRVYTEFNYHRYIPMLDWITDGDGNIKVNFIGRYENLEKDFEEICKRIGFPNLDLVKTNTAEMCSGMNRKHYSYYYDDELKEIVENLFKKDIEYFGYTFEKHD